MTSEPSMTVTLDSRAGPAFAEFDYPWAGTKDPREAAFTAWIDRSAELDDSVHALLRARRRALTDKRWGEAEAVREDLAARGVVVRDRGAKQQYRLLRS